MKSRRLLSAAEVVELREFLNLRLDKIGLETQPEIAVKVLNLNQNPEAQLKDYAEVVRADPALSGRLLKLANSAYFAQRSPVTSLDRACLLLGLERLRAIALGFHLCRAASPDKGPDMTRRLWGQSVFRACVAAEVARATAPAFVSEAFVVGLMMDAGIPLMSRLVGPRYAELLAENSAPGKLYRAEFHNLEFTHIDVIATLAHRWRLPELLAQPIEWHHTAPADARRTEPVHRLHRIGYSCAIIDLGSPVGVSKAVPIDENCPGIATAQRLLGIAGADLSSILQRANSEYLATQEMFADVAEPIGSVDDLVERIRIGMIEAMDQVLVLGLDVGEDTGGRLRLGGQEVEIERENDGMAVLFLYDSRGQRLLEHRFDPGAETPHTLCTALGLDPDPADDADQVVARLQRLAA